MLLLYCPKLKGGGTRDVLACLYHCPKATRGKCKEYMNKWDAVQVYQVDQKYIDKYGEPKKIVPVALRRRRARKVIVNYE